MGEFNEALNLKTQAPAVILMAGLQGSGKTTTVAKLARWLQQSQKKSVLVASADIYRPAAIDQLAKLASDVDVECYPSNPQQDPVTIAQGAIQYARNKVMNLERIQQWVSQGAQPSDRVKHLIKVHKAAADAQPATA